MTESGQVRYQVGQCLVWVSQNSDVQVLGFATSDRAEKKDLKSEKRRRAEEEKKF